MRRSQFATVLFFSASISGVYAAGSPKTVDCLLVSVVPQSADPDLAANPTPLQPGTRPLHMILTNVCSVDITAFKLDINVTSPIPQERHPSVDMLGSLARLNDKKIPRARTEFPYDSYISAEPEDDSRPLELTVKVRGLIFRDGTAAGDALWVSYFQENRKKMVQQFATELRMLAQIARLEDAKAILKGEPDPSLKGAVRAFWLENKSNVGNDPAKWAAFINPRASHLQSLVELMSEHPELTMEDKWPATEKDSGIRR
jgi:hypothetical protein